MATIGVVAGTALEPARERRVFTWLTAAMVVTAFAAFAPTYWLQVPAGTFTGSGLVHLHAMLFSSWVVLVAWQAWLAARGRVARWPA